MELSGLDRGFQNQMRPQRRRDDQKTFVFRLLVPGAPEHRGLDPVLGQDRSRRVGIPFWDRDLFLSAREIGIGAVLGLLVGVITTVLLSRR